MVKYKSKPALIEAADKWAEDWRKRWVPLSIDVWFQTYFKINPSDEKTRKPRKGDLVEYDDRLGTIGWVDGEYVNVYFGGDLEEFDRDLFFKNYDTPRGRTKWRL